MMTLDVAEGHHVSLENQEEIDFILVDTNRKTFLALLPQFIFEAVVHCGP